jgi:N-acetylmuramoyl-L-alanine amidase
LKPKVVVIDPGHPAAARDFGTKGKKLTEVQANFHVASMLVAMLNKQGVKAMLTRNNVNLLLSNKRRAEISNWAHADLYVRIHCDQTTGSGYSIFYPTAPGVAPDGVKGPSAKVIKGSFEAAKAFHAAMAAAMGTELPDGGFKPDNTTPVGAKQGALTGSIYSEAPTLLVNLVVLGNPRDETWILNRKNPPKLIAALDKGVLAALGMDQE